MIWKSLFVLALLVIVTTGPIAAALAQLPKETQPPVLRDEIPEDLKAGVDAFAKSVRSKQKGRTLISNEGPPTTPEQLAEKIRQRVAADMRSVPARKVQDGDRLWLWLGLSVLTLFLLGAAGTVVGRKMMAHLKNMEDITGRQEQSINELKELVEQEPPLDEPNV